jgi:uridine kinase
MDDQVEVQLPEKSIRVAPDTSLRELLAPYNDASDPVVAARVNNEVLSLSRRIRINAELRPVHLSSAAGVRIYRQSLCSLLALAVARKCPERNLVIGHSLGDGYFFYFKDDRTASTDDIEMLREEMRELVAKDLPIVRQLISYQDAREHFHATGQLETAALLEHRNESRVAVHECDNYIDLSHGPLVPSTGLLTAFDLEVLDPGFMLRYPSRQEPTTVRREAHSPLLFSIYREYKEWGRVLGVTSVGRLNDRVREGTIAEFIAVNEALQERKIANIAQTVAEQRNGSGAHDSAGVVLIAGPSSSGKTTFTKKLAVQLSALGLQPALLSVDDYFVDREHTPKDENGEYDFESIHALDVPLLNEHILQLMNGEPVALPRFDFKFGRREESGHTLKLGERGVLLMEGIHCLNDELTPRINRSRKFKIYISALTQLNLDDHNRISTTDNRLVRRMVRDYQFRGHSAADTLRMWPSVRRGEQRNIFPFQDTADVGFNSALDYELGVLKKHAEPLLRQVKPEDPVYNEAVGLAGFLGNFLNIPDKLVPDYSIVREFVGDSGFRY